jgi:hypothetical protein
LPSMAGTGRKHQAVTTLAPTPEQIPNDPAERAAYFGVYGTTQPKDLKDARDRRRAGREEEARLKAAGRSNRLPPSLSARNRWLDKFRKFARRLTGRDIDTRLLTEAQRTRLAADRDAERLAAGTDPRPLRIAALMDWRRRALRFRIATGRITGRHIDTRLLSEAQREQLRQMRETERESDRQQQAGQSEAVRRDTWTLRPRRRPAPD